eukprot:2349690-Pleurochrysis_carterae.AAC.2
MQLLRLLSEEEEGGDYSWGSTNVITAVLVSLGAGLATGVGGLVVFAPQEGLFPAWPTSPFRLLNSQRRP